MSTTMRAAVCVRAGGPEGAGGPGSPATDANSRELQALFQHATSPRFAVTLMPTGKDSDYEAALNRFLDQYLTGP